MLKALGIERKDLQPDIMTPLEIAAEIEAGKQ